MALVTKARGLRAADASRPRDVDVLDFFAKWCHLVVDAVVTTVYRNTIFTNASAIPGYVAKQAKDRKILADRASSQPIVGIHGGPHVLVRLFALGQADYMFWFRDFFFPKRRRPEGK